MPPSDSTADVGEERSTDPQQSMPPLVQRLYDACRLAFVGAEEKTLAEMQGVISILEQIKPVDVGLEASPSSDAQRGFGFFGNGVRRGRRHSVSSRWAPPITYLHLYECEEFSMGIFCLPTSAAIPLHDHPGMTVMSKVLYGSMHVQSYDWVDPSDARLNEAPSEARLATREADEVMKAPCATEVLYPTRGGNIHAFTAITPCAVLDVLAPPYCAESGRHCTYYREVAGPPGQRRSDDGKSEEDNLCWLEVYQPPDDFVVQRGLYKGPPILP